MGAYRIGRFAGPWKNFTPPIRGGVFRKNPPHECENHEDDSIEDGTSTDTDTDTSLVGSEDELVASRVSSNTSLETEPDTTWKLNEEKSKDVLLTVQSGFHDDTRRGRARRRAGRNSNCSSVPSSSPNPFKHTQTREEYTSETMQKEIDDDLAAYPSLDAATQGEIVRQYQALHERVKNEGFYDCRYTEYLKETVRYCALFSIFLLLLRAEWYLTSAACLGLFWVCLSSWRAEFWTSS